MSYFSKVSPITNKVVQVMVADQEFISTIETPEYWFETSKDVREGIVYDENNVAYSDQETAIAEGYGRHRKNFGNIGMIYDSERDMFYLPRPAASWSLNETYGVWEPPIAKPSTPDGTEDWVWDEDSYQADNTTGWIDANAE